MTGDFLRTDVALSATRYALRNVTGTTRLLLNLEGVRNTLTVPGNGELLLKPGGGRSAQGGSVQCSH